MSGATWDSYPSYASQEYFKGIMEGHTKVDAVEKVSPSRWDLTLTNRSIVRVFITDIYTFSASDYERLHAQYPDVGIIVSASRWNHFSDEAAEKAKADEVVTVPIGGLMSKLHDFVRTRPARS